ERVGEVGHELAAAAVGDGAEELVGDGFDARLELLDPTGGEGAVDQSSQPGVVRRVEEQQQVLGTVEERTGLGGVGPPKQSAQGSEVKGAEIDVLLIAAQAWVSEKLAHFVMAGQKPHSDRVLVDRVESAQSVVDRVGVGA